MLRYKTVTNICIIKLHHIVGNEKAINKNEEKVYILISI